MKIRRLFLKLVLESFLITSMNKIADAVFAGPNFSYKIYENYHPDHSDGGHGFIQVQAEHDHSAISSDPRLYTGPYTGWDLNRPTSTNNGPRISGAWKAKAIPGHYAATMNPVASSIVTVTPPGSRTYAPGTTNPLSINHPIKWDSWLGTKSGWATSPPMPPKILPTNNVWLAGPPYPGTWHSTNNGWGPAFWTGSPVPQTIPTVTNSPVTVSPPTSGTNAPVINTPAIAPPPSSATNAHATNTPVTATTPTSATNVTVTNPSVTATPPTSATIPSVTNSPPSASPPRPATNAAATNATIMVPTTAPTTNTTATNAPPITPANGPVPTGSWTPKPPGPYEQTYSDSHKFPVNKGQSFIFSFRKPHPRGPPHTKITLKYKAPTNTNEFPAFVPNSFGGWVPNFG